MTTKLCLNVGCGDRTYDFYPTNEYKCINFDARAGLKRVDEIGDIRDLSRFEDSTFEYMLCSDIIEHFPISETGTILKEWGRVLKPSGIIEFRLPDLSAICKKYIEGKNDAKLTSWLLYGAQTYPGNFHYVAFDRKWLSDILKGNGFEIIEIKDSGNNFELKAAKK